VLQTVGQLRRRLAEMSHAESCDFALKASLHCRPRSDKMSATEPAQGSEVGSAASGHRCGAGGSCQTERKAYGERTDMALGAGAKRGACHGPHFFCSEPGSLCPHAAALQADRHADSEDRQAPARQLLSRGPLLCILGRTCKPLCSQVTVPSHVRGACGAILCLCGPSGRVWSCSECSSGLLRATGSRLRTCGDAVRP